MLNNRPYAGLDDATAPLELLLLCFAHAGGSAQVFRDWQALMPTGVRVRPVELPGRGRRFREALQTDYAALVDGLAREIGQEITALQRRQGRVLYAGFGHSAGATFNFAVCARLAEQLGRPPVHCFLSAGTPPLLAKKPRSLMSDAALVEEINSFPGAPLQAMGNPDVLDFFLPILRADFAAYEASTHDGTRLLDCPFTLFAAATDTIAPNEIWAWREHTTHPVRRVTLAGDHFSVVMSPKALIEEIRRDIQEEILL